MSDINKNTGSAEYESVVDVDIKQLIPNVIEDYIVTIFEGHHTIFLPNNITGSQFRTWHKGKGGVFSKDVLNYSLKKPHGKYVIIKDKTLNCVVRLIDDEEETQFKAMKLIDGKIKDKPYMIFKHIENNQKLFSTSRYIKDEDVIEDNIYIPDLRNTESDDYDHHKGSISLFDD